MFDDVLIESAGKDKNKGTWITALISAVLHLGIVGAIIAAGMYVKENPEVIEQPMSAFIVASAPPPPPPPPAGSAGSRPQVTKVETPRERPRQEFRQPSDTPRDVPQVDLPRDDDSGAVEGGQVGGVKGGQAGGVVGGQLGGVAGGQLGGIVGGQLGGTGTGDTPVRVGGNVKAPVAVTRVDPLYTESARRARIQGLVIIEAVIDRQGNVTEARVLKPLPLGLDTAALEAVKRWKFRPGTLNGQPVPVYYNLTVNFQLQ
ncbi:MAG TPA: energy transducer TonB [Thermoanaerobaculia bacterium]